LIDAVETPGARAAQQDEITVEKKLEVLRNRRACYRELGRDLARRALLVQDQSEDAPASAVRQSS
jgi:hypothetical protein